VKIGISRGRKTSPKLKIGICGEHGGDPESVTFCHKAGMNYVSCSPYRVPIASLAAAQAAVADKAKAKPAKKAKKKPAKKKAKIVRKPARKIILRAARRPVPKKKATKKATKKGKKKR